MARTEFSDALRGVYRDIDEVHGDEQTVDYKEINSLAILSIVASVISCLGFFFKPFILLAVIGFVLGLQAFRKILRSPEELGGLALATSGMALGCLIGVSATIFQVWHYYHNAPPGYDVVEFDSLAFDKKGKVRPEILALDGKKVYITGYMYPTDRHAGIENFQLVRLLGHCKFCSPGTNPADMIAVDLERGMSVSFRANKVVGVGGIFYVDPDFKPGEIPYSMEADVFRK
jgi:hypothetical protein